MQKFLQAAVFFLLAISATLEAKYTERLLVQVADQNYRLIEGAEVYVYYQLNAVKGFIYSKPVLTNEKGEAEILFSNYEEIESSEDRSYTLYVKYGRNTYSTKMIAENYTGSIVPIRKVGIEVEAYLLSVRVADQNKKPLPARVTINKKTLETDATGHAYFILGPGNYTVKVEGAGIVRSEIIRLEEDTPLEIEIGLYDLSVKAIDDKGMPLVASVEVDGKGFYTGQDGTLLVRNLTNHKPQVVVGYNNTYKEFSPNLKNENELLAVFDMGKPVISELHVGVSKAGVGEVRVFAEDRGKAASGIESVLVSYEVDGVVDVVPAYVVGYNTFEAKIPAQKEGKVVSYTVRISDKEGNTVAQGGSYIVPKEERPQLNANNSTGPQSDLPLPKMNLETIVIGIGIGVLIAYGVFYYFSRRKERQMPPVPKA
ncbi:MAG: carboxypeptidase-like regulatory domain-containing protein [Candidatus Micrarchaeota archaeon]|nr:carboxypeptidase-like regulatory domain-containing protein [Candidatus Micrarchaeota archaeon]